MAQYPDEIYAPRTMENRDGSVYDETRTKDIYAEDFNLDRNEIVAIENELGINAKGTYESVSAALSDILSKILVGSFREVTDDPADGSDGLFIINTTDNTLKMWYSNQWVTLHTLPPPPPPLTEISCWEFNEDLLDSVDSNDLTDHGSTDDASGKFGHARAFDSGSNQFADCVNNANIDLQTSFSFTSWIKIPTGNTGYFCGFSTVYGSYVKGIGFDSGNLLYVRCDGLSLVSFDSDISIPTDEWVLIGFIVDLENGKMKSWINDTKKEVSITGMPVLSGSKFSIGRLGEYPLYFNGSVDRFRIYNKALSDDEYLALLTEI